MFGLSRDSHDGAAEISEWVQKMHALVIGPGLGRDHSLLVNVKVSLPHDSIPFSSLIMYFSADGSCFEFVYK